MVSEDFRRLSCTPRITKTIEETNVQQQEKTAKQPARGALVHLMEKHGKTWTVHQVATKPYKTTITLHKTPKYIIIP